MAEHASHPVFTHVYARVAEMGGARSGCESGRRRGDPAARRQRRCDRRRLVDVNDLDERQVTVVQTPNGTLAVGISQGEPFAVSNRCRHLLASLGKGHVAEDGCLQCPWHAGPLRRTNRRDDTRSTGRTQTHRRRREEHHRRDTTEDLPGRVARRRDLAARRCGRHPSSPRASRRRKRLMFLGDLPQLHPGGHRPLPVE